MLSRIRKFSSLRFIMASKALRNRNPIFPHQNIFAENQFRFQSNSNFGANDKVVIEFVMKHEISLAENQFQYFSKENDDRMEHYWTL